MIVPWLRRITTVRPGRGRRRARSRPRLGREGALCSPSSGRACAAARFAQPHQPGPDLTPAQAGLLRLIAWKPGQSQQAIARQLGTPASRLVLLVDGLEERALIERRRDPADRRHYALYLTEDGTAFMKELGRLGAAHEDAMTEGLTADERAVLNDLLSRLAARQDLTTGVHPGYRRT